MIDGATAEISAAIDFLTQGACQGFSFGSSDPCLQPPVPFNMAFLAPGTFNLFGCPIFEDKGLPLLFFPATLITPIGPLPSVGPVGFSSAPSDSFWWVPGGTYPSMIRIYAAPTLTAQMGLAVCFGPQGAALTIPPPFRDLGGNCVVFAFSLPSCGGDGNDAQEISTPEIPRVVAENFGNSCGEPWKRTLGPTQ